MVLPGQVIRVNRYVLTGQVNRFPPYCLPQGNCAVYYAVLNSGSDLMASLLVEGLGVGGGGRD
eukprot:3938602-Rhodomonas_salina.2